MTKNVPDNASGWQITDISAYAKTQSFRKERAFYFNIYVKQSDGFHLSCYDMKRLFALDCGMDQKTNNFPFTDNILPALTLYKSGDYNPFKLPLDKRSANPLLAPKVQAAKCKRVSKIVHLQNYVPKGDKVIEPLTVDQGQCVIRRSKASPTTYNAKSLCTPLETRDQSVVVEREKEQQAIVKLKNFIVYRC